MTIKRFYRSLLVLLCALITCSGFAYAANPATINFHNLSPDLLNSTLFQQDTAKLDSAKIEPYKPTRKPIYQPIDRFGDPFSNRTNSSPLLLQDPSNLQLEVEIDTGMNYTIHEKIGDLNYRPTSSMTFEEFNEYKQKQQLKNYWKNRSAGLDGESAVSGRNLIPPIYVSPIFDRIFGGTYVEIIPRGFVTLDFGGRWQRINNPAIPIRQQRSGGFEFDQQISMNVVGKIGEKLQVTANFDNNNSFDFENNLKVEYTGFEEDILQKLEIGNVSLPLTNTLISGAQNLFGVKAQLQFGDLHVTTVASTQRGKAETITIDGGGVQGREFAIKASDYEENRHFFLGHFFRDNFEQWLAGIPYITSGINITRVEVYVVNRNNDTQTLRNVVGLMDLAEHDPENIYRDMAGDQVQVVPTGAVDVNYNDANNLLDIISNVSRNADEVNNELEQLGFENGLDFEKITSARKLSPNEYIVNSRLGYITLFRKLQNDEALAVAYEYTYNGKSYKVGELSEDYTNLEEEKVIFLKLLRPRKINITDAQGNRVPTWDLMMKNIYGLNGTNISREGFQLRVIYRDDKTGIDNPQLQEGATASTKPLIEIFGLDKLNQSNDPQRDGNFDFVEGITIEPETGLIIFPYLEPFSDALREEFEGDPREETLVNKYAYDELYNQTQSDAELVSNKNKFVISGRFQAGSTSEIMIPGINIAEGSVRIYAGGSPLQEGVDYQVDYNFGRVTIINEGILHSGKQLTISYEQADLFNFQSRTLLGTRFDYRIDEDITFGATLLHLNERPLISRISVGNEPTRNTKYGFDVNIHKESRFLTKMLDKLPLIQTKEPSSVTFNAEFAQLLPGTSNVVDGEGTSYIDDFENTATPMALGNPMSWKLASTPETGDDRFNGKSNGLDYGYKRAKIAWYEVDNLFYRDDRRKPDGISDEDLRNHYVRQVTPQEIFPNLDPNVINIQPIFDIAYYPAERGPYNLNPAVAGSEGIFTSAAARKSNWGGITNAINTEVDFDKANVEYIEFWLMDPFINTAHGTINDGRGTNKPNETGGDLYFNLGSISEDFIPDSKHAFENGLPADGFDLENPVGVDRNDPWGFVTSQQFLTNAFDNSARANQDVGLDGISSDEEKIYGPFQQFSDFPDPAADDFKYFLGGEHDAKDAGILERYKDYNGLENNSPVSDNTSLFTPAANNNPDNEDINNDNTLNELEEYYEYKVELRPNNLENHKYVVDKITERVTGENVTWYLFRIPIRQPDNTYGGISGFKSIKYLRTYLTNFSEPVVLRMANFRFVASRWRRYGQSLRDAQFNEPPEPEDFTNLTVSVVNIEENGAGSETSSPYVLPPGFDRDRDNTSSVERRLNEQSLQVCVEDLEDANARAVTKQVSLDLINYGRIKMFLHADSELAEDGEVTAFLRLGSDIDSNYYEIEVPLKITPQGAMMAEDIWPAQNEINLDVDELYALKSERDRLNISKRELFPLNGHKVVGNNRIRLRGNPDMSAITWLTIGIRNPRSDGAPKSVCVWANELRVTDFDRTKGWAANAIFNTKLADFANVTATARHTAFGFGGIQSKIAERTREETTSYDISANISVDKLLPEQLGLKIPMYVSYEKSTIKPKYDPANPDITLEASLLSLETDQERNEYKQLVTDEETRKSINFTNVRKEKVNPDAKKHIYDIENLSFTYAYSEMLRTNFNLQELYQQNYNAAIAYNYNPEVKPWEPFKDLKFLDSPFLQLIKDFNINPLPSSLSFRADLRREFRKTVYRNNLETFNNDLANYEKYFTFNRSYDLQWDFTNNLSVDYSARANAIIDEPSGDIDSDVERDSIITNLKHLGRMKNFDQTISANYRLPLDKLPITDWINADYRYQTNYAWTAGPINQPEELDFGNVIQNSRDNTLSGKVDMVKLYNKINFLEEINSPPRNTRRSSLPQQQQEQDTTTQKPENKGLKGFAKLLMSVKSLNGTYTLREGTMLPGFKPRAFLFGLDSSFNAPGIPFILGSQDPSIRRSLASDGFITTNNQLTAPFVQTKTVDYNIRANVEPVKDLKIQLDLNKTKNSSFEEIFRNVADDGEVPVFESLNPSRSGGYAISFLTIKTAFAKDDENHNSPVFQDFESNRLKILERFNQETGIEYDSNSQDVLIPAFIAAYSGMDPLDVSLSPFPATPLPNWHLDYTGLGRIPALKEVFQSVSISHGYRSSYAVTHFTNSLEYTEGMELNASIEDYNVSRFGRRNSEGDIVPVFIISQALISEQFSPLIGINVRTKSRLTAKLEYNIKRDVALNISNAQITEMRSNDIVFELGFTKANFKLPFKSQGRVISLKNDLTFRLSFTLRDTETIQRKIDGVNTITNGSINLQLRPNISYVLNEKLNLQFYFERNINEPKISSSFRRATTRMGIQIRFSLAQ